ncbi:MAG: hypothetical protein E6K72_09245 [Candidatus Eisenbacteria bacterium]|uniref:Uncharacterized protein n=1 Tax=Eiseniibacteriota bacterium TaxID=2212470 RepID=A0A538SM05_UNCEI|nr:MAG: hypothetical protein E6K72_09245 [Candidatus Eisenbacteria bacterium]
MSIAVIVALTCAFADAEAEGFAPGSAVLLVNSAEAPTAPPASTWIASFSVVRDVDHVAS